MYSGILLLGALGGVLTVYSLCMTTFGIVDDRLFSLGEDRVLVSHFATVR